jgi:hypothetical protein
MAANAPKPTLMIEQFLATFGTLLTFMGWHPNVCSVVIAVVPVGMYNWGVSTESCH